MQDFKEKLAEEYKLDIRVIDLIVNHPFKFLKDCVTSTDDRPLLIHKLGTFTLKPYRTKYMMCMTLYMSILKLKTYNSNIVNILNELGYKVYTVEEAENIVTDILIKVDFDKLKLIRDRLKSKYSK